MNKIDLWAKLKTSLILAKQLAENHPTSTSRNNTFDLS